MANVHPTAFDTATIGDDDRTLTITFWSGVEPCAVLDHVDVAYGADAVTVTLFQGSDPIGRRCRLHRDRGAETGDRHAGRAARRPAIVDGAA